MRKLTWKNCIGEIKSRGGEIDIETDRGDVQIDIIDKRRVRGRTLALLRAEGWRQYTRRESHHATLAYLCGNDDNGLWAVRVPGTVKTVRDALLKIEPAAVRKARAKGKRVLRQGDVYAVETKRDCHSDLLRAYRGTVVAVSEHHEFFPCARVLIHGDPDRPHAPMVVPFPCKFFQQHAYGMGRGAGMGAAD